jgi:hypothetical protein
MAEGDGRAAREREAERAAANALLVKQQQQQQGGHPTDRGMTGPVPVSAKPNVQQGVAPKDRVMTSPTQQQVKPDQSVQGGSPTDRTMTGPVGPKPSTQQGGSPTDRTMTGPVGPKVNTQQGGSPTDRTMTGPVSTKASTQSATDPTARSLTSAGTTNIPPNNNAQIVAGVPDNKHQISVSDAGGQIANDPSLLLNDNEQLSKRVPTATSGEIAAGTIQNGSKYGANPSQFNAKTHTGTTSLAHTPQENTRAAQVNTDLTQSKVAGEDMTGAHGSVDPNALIDPNQTGIDLNEFDNSVAGQALKESAQQNISNIIDTSTASGKLLAQQLGEGNYTDSKATLKGQLDMLQNEFVDPNTGEPKIPSWAAATARNVGRIASFTGMSGTAATAAMSQALLEASLPIAQADSQFFQTVTLKNLDNRQQSTINRANVLSKISMANMDQRMTAAVENANKFMQMDMANLDHDQQAAVINNQNRVQSILEDSKATNANRLFMAQSQNEKDMFYSNLNASISEYNASQSNQMKQFNASEANHMEQFNSGLENNRQQFYQNMQFQIDTANTKWRQTLTLQHNEQMFQAHATDVKNLVGIQTEELNRLWDRSDALLDYAWKGSENQADRKNQIALMKLDGQQKLSASEQEGMGSLLGTLLGIGGNLLMGAFGF